MSLLTQLMETEQTKKNESTIELYRTCMHDVIVDLLNSLSAVKGLSELKSESIIEKELIAKALSVLIQNQDMERCSFFLFDGEECLTNVTGLSFDEKLDSKNEPNCLTFKIGEGVIGIAAQTGELQHSKDCSKDERFLKVNFQSGNFYPGSLISVPVIVAEELLGVLNISHPEPNYFSEWHVRLLQIYKNMLGQMITNCRLFQKMEEQLSLRTSKLEKVLQDVKLLKERYQSLSMIDELTGLYNRRYFYAQAEIAMSRAIRYGQSLCLLMIDIDFFKQLNDQFGHLCGDQVLISVSSLLKQQMRDSDILVRYGGEEFLVIFSNTDCQNGKVFAERIREEIDSACIEYDNQSIKTSVSIGVYCLDGEYTRKEQKNIDRVIRYADLALYDAKDKGRNQVRVFTQDLLDEN